MAVQGVSITYHDDEQQWRLPQGSEQRLQALAQALADFFATSAEIQAGVIHVAKPDNERAAVFAAMFSTSSAIALNKVQAASFPLLRRLP